MKENMEHIDIMQSVKPVSVLPGFGAATTAQMEGYFGVSSYILKKAIKAADEAGELKNFAFTLKPEDFDKAGYELRTSTASRKRYVKDGLVVTFMNNQKVSGGNSIHVYTKTAMIQIAKHLPNSEVAVSIMRNIGWNVPNNTTNNTTKKRNNTVKEDIKMEETGIDYAENSSLPMQIFENPEFGSVRTVEVDGEAWLVGKDVAEALGYERATKAIQDHVDKEDKDEVPIRDSIGRMQKTPIINESGLYSLVMSSKLPDAKKFRRWVTSEVLPAIRKNGGYIANQEKLTPSELMAKALIVAQKTIEEREARINSLVCENKVLSDKNLELSAANKALIGTISEWKRSSVLNALVRSLFPKIKAAPGDKFRAAWNWFYKELNYKYSINLKIRRSRGDSRKCLLDFLKEDEWPKALSVAAAMCERCGINVADVINEVNAQKVS